MTGAIANSSGKRDVRHGEENAARIGHTSFQSVYGDVGPQKRNIVSQVNHHPT